MGVSFGVEVKRVSFTPNQFLVAQEPEDGLPEQAPEGHELLEDELSEREEEAL